MYVYRLNSQLSMLRMPTRSYPVDAEELIAHGNAAAGTRYRRGHARASGSRPQLDVSGVQWDVLARDDRALRGGVARKGRPTDPRRDRRARATVGRRAGARAGEVIVAVAVITDIHGNLPALQAALARIGELGIKRIYCGGDLVGYGPHPNQVCALIAERRIPSIYGNYDYAIARDLEDCGCAYITPHDRALGQQSVRWTLAHTDQASKDFMRGLRFDLRFALGEHEVHLVHGSPRKVNEYLFEEKPARLYERLAAAETARALVFGYTHKPWV